LNFYKSSEQRVPLVYYAFDLLSLEGKDLRKEPLSARRKLLAEALKKAPENIRLSGELRGSKEELLRVAQEFGLEELVAKRLSFVNPAKSDRTHRSPNQRSKLFENY
jgi:bifunctional non-homologous end joining protein LigD